MNPLFNSSGYVLDARELKVLQKDGWISLPLAEIVELKKHSLATFVVRLSDGRKMIVELSHLSTDAFAKVSGALKKALQDYRATIANLK
jgi:hypothetical protein